MSGISYISNTQVARDFDLVVNCTGLGAKQLAVDENMEPIKGQVIKVMTEGRVRWAIVMAILSFTGEAHSAYKHYDALFDEEWAADLHHPWVSLCSLYI